MKTTKDKIDALILNSNKLLKSSKNISESGDFGTATAILVTAFEEKTKAVVLQIIELGFPIVNNLSDLDYIFRQHDARHYIGYFIDCLYEIINDLKKLIDRFRNDKNYIRKLANFAKDKDVQKDILEWGFKKIESFMAKIDFYQNIERTRQAGLYVDVLNHNFGDQEITENEYKFVKRRLQKVHLLSKDLFNLKLNFDMDELDAIDKSKENLEKANVPIHLLSAIQIVKKERSKAFNILRKQLLYLKDELSAVNINES